MTGPTLLLAAMEQAMTMRGEGCTHEQENLPRLLVRILLGGAGGVGDLSSTILERCDMQLWAEVYHFAAEGFTYGEIYDGLAERVITL